MQKTILVIDDSKNIQKVVGIIFEDKNYQIEQCLTTDAITKRIAESKPDLILLDFSLDETKSGYELVDQIKKTFKGKVILLYGTFDTVDENMIEAHAIDGHIFKPFDGDKLINLCATVLGEPIVEGGTITRVVHKTEAVGDESDWGIQIPEVIGEATQEIENDLIEDNQRIPGIIGDELPSGEIPEQMREFTIEASRAEEDLEAALEESIEEAVKEVTGIKEITATKQIETPDALFPSPEDLEYPEIAGRKAMKTRTGDRRTNKDDADIRVEASSSKLISADSLNISQEEQEFERNEKATPEPTAIVSMDLRTEEETLSQLKKQILDEIDEDRWDSGGTGTDIVVGKLGEDVVRSNTFNRDVLKNEIILELQEDLLKKVQGQIRSTVQNSLGDKLPEMVRKELVPKFEQSIEDYCREAVEKGMWEILPDLAEKVIKRELQAIRESMGL